MRKRFSYLLPFLLCTCLLWGQQAKQYVFSRYNTGNGLASNFVNNLVQDQRGYIWLATINGLQRYDGHKFITYKHQPDNPLTVPSDNISSVYFDKRGNLWVLTSDNKIGTFNTATYTYKEVPVKLNPTENSNLVGRLIETKIGKLLLFIGGLSMYSFDSTSNSFRPADIIPVPPGWKCNVVREDVGSNRFWMACDSGLALFNPATRHLNYRGHNIDNDPVIRQLGNDIDLINIAADDPERFYLITWNPMATTPTLTVYDKKREEKKQFNISKYIRRGYHEIFGSLHQRNGRQWFYGMPFIVEYKGGVEPFELVNNEYRDEQSISFDRINNMYEDREKNVWICSDNGVFLFNPDAQVFYTYNLERTGDKQAIEGPAQAVLRLSNKQIWVGTWGKGLYCYDENFKPVPIPEGLKEVRDSWSIWCMLEQRSTGLIWIGLQGGGLIVYNPANGATKTFFPEIFKGRTIRQVTEDNMGNLWFGSHGGHIVKWNKTVANGDVEKGYELLTKSLRIQKMLTDNKGFVWAATLGRGLYKINPVNNDTIVFKRNGPPGRRLFDDGPMDILQYNDSTLLIANGTVDIINTNTNTVTTISTQDGLPSNDVQCLQKDQDGLVWLGMLSGLTRMIIDKKIFILYDRRDGIRYDIFNVAGAFKLPNSNLVFTTDHNFLVFNPQKMVQKVPPPDVKILEFKMANNALLLDSLLRRSKIQLDYDKNSISISFGTLSYLRNNKKLFYYQLEKVDAGWILADERHQAIYNYIPPGSYTFRVKCINGYGLSSVHTTELSIIIKAPFWKSWWFYSILLLVAIGVLYWIDKERIRRLITLQQLRTQIADNLHKDINTTLNNIHLLSEIAKIKADKDIEKSKEYIDQINTKSRRMIGDMDDMLWSINPQNDSMQKTLERMIEFADGIKKINDCKIDLIVEEKVRWLKLDMKMRHEIFFIFKEALNSIIQHSNCTNSIINIDLVKSNLLIQIHDNGSGIDTKSLQNSTGIKEMTKRAKLLNALLDIQSDKKGTAVILRVPV